MKIKIADIQFMLSVLSLPTHLRHKLESVSLQEVDLSDEEADLLRDLCGERLQVSGFDKNHEPTEEGRRLEELIDKLFIG